MEKDKMIIMGVSKVGKDKDKPRESEWFFEKNEKKKYKYYHQQEPVIEKLLLDGKRVEKVISLCSKEVREEIIDIEGEKYSSVSYLESRINKFVDENDLDIKLDFEVISMNEEDGVEKNIIELVEKIRGYHNKYDFFVDIHGGFRDDQYLLSDVIKVLSYEGIKPEDVLTVHWDPVTSIGVVKNVNDYKIMEFFAGLSEFRNTGRGDGLERFISKIVEEGTTEAWDKKAWDKILEFVTGISDSIALCDMDRFDEALDEYYKWVNQRNEQEKKQEEKLIDLFVKYISKVYEDIINPDTRTIVREIKWCKKKGFIQQALTLIESKMPMLLMECISFEKEKFVKKKTFSNDIRIKDDRKRYKKFCEEFKGKPWETCNEKAGEVVKNIRKSYGKDENFILETIGYSVLPKNAKGDSLFETQRQIPKHDPKELLKNLTSGIDYDSEIYSKKYKYNNYYLFFSETEGVDAIDIDSSIKKDFFDTLAMHMWLKKQRNKTNHAAEEKERVTSEDMNKAIDLYICSYEKLIKTVNGIYN